MPTSTPLSYFEVTIEKLILQDGNAEPFELGVGFCEEHVALESMVGVLHGSWGHHLGNGQLYNESGTGISDLSYTEKYAEGDTIGCGINFRDRTAFFTKNGTLLGEY
jgi:Ran-binding protein 9/10